MFYTEDNIIKIGNFLLDNKHPKIDKNHPANLKSQIGTPLILAPEQFMAMHLVSGEKEYEVKHFDDFEADIWGLGCLIFYILTFTYPFNGKTLDDMMKIFLNPVGIKVPDLPNVMKFDDKNYQDLKRIVSGCLKVNVEERLTAAEVQNEIHLIMTANKIEHAPHSFFYSESDFKGFFSYVSSKLGKPAD